jgi:hypothetical protein
MQDGPLGAIAMRHFKLIAETRHSREPEIVEFEAQEIGIALDMAADLVRSSQAEMWCDGERLCTLSRAGESGAHFWQIS